MTINMFKEIKEDTNKLLDGFPRKQTAELNREVNMGCENGTIKK